MDQTRYAESPGFFYIDEDFYPAEDLHPTVTPALPLTPVQAPKYISNSPQLQSRLLKQKDHQ